MQAAPQFRLLLRSLCVFTFFISCISVHAQKGINEKVDRIINKAMKEEQFPGMAVAVIRNGQVLFEKTYGVKSVTGKDKTDVQTLFSIGSASKAFTGIGVMLLVQQGKIGLDDPIKKHLPGLPKAWGNITIRQYMTHTSGIPDVKGEKDDASFEATIRKVGQLPMAFSPGQKQQYNNFNFAVLGKLIEAVSGMTYLDYMTKQVFKPLDMHKTGVQPVNQNIALGHMLKNGQWKELETHFRPGDYGVPSGGLQTTLADFIKLSQGLNKNTLLTAKTKNEMWMPYSAQLSNTPGWHSRKSGKDIIIHKAGGGTGIGSVCDFKIVPSQNLFVIVMANKANNQVSPSEITDEILSQCFNVPKDKNGAGAGEGNER